MSTSKKVLNAAILCLTLGVLYQSDSLMAKPLNSSAKHEISIVPAPVTLVETKQAPFLITKKTRICYKSSDAKAPAELLAIC